jgi:NAD(P)-dependent dehydrogenase (short-subunit alcohol dehydrogenase family)
LERVCGELPGSGHTWSAFDVRDEDGWQRLAADVNELAGLVCSAAVIEPIGPVGSFAPSEFRRAVETNLFGSYLAIHYCLPALSAAEGAVVLFGGGGATAPQPRFDAYAASKAGVVRLTENLAPVLGELAVSINCVAPGFVVTRMQDATLAAGPERAGSRYFQKTVSGVEAGGFPASEAAELVCTLLGGVPFSGKLISAQWDPWRDSAFRERLASDANLGTLRRIDSVQYATIDAPA